MERTQRTLDPWTYGDADMLGVDLTRGVDLAGFEVEAVDGGIGKVDEATYDVGSSFLVIDTGPWIFGKKVLIPAGIVERVDLDSQTVFVSRPKDEIKDSPEFDEATYRDETYRNRVGDYYGGSRDEPLV